MPGVDKGECKKKWNKEEAKKDYDL